MRKILIAGGGIGGLTLAIDLARRGIGSHILERRAAFSEAGAGIQIGPNGTRILRDLAVLDRLAPFAGRPDALKVMSGASGRRLTKLPLGIWIEQRHGAPYWVLHRRDLQNALLDAARDLPAITITNGFAVANVDESADSIAALSGDGARARGDCLIGADGIWSQVRRTVFAPGELPPSGKIAARAVVPAAGLAPPFGGNEVGIWLMKDAHVVHYPVHAGQDIAVVVILSGERIGLRGGKPGAQQTGNGPSWETACDAAGLFARLGEVPSALQDFLGKVGDWRQWSLFDPPALPTWSKGRVALLGDAAHPVLPFLAQGAVMAMEDAVVLSKALAETLAPSAPLLAADAATQPPRIADALARYAARRRPRCARVQKQSRRNGQIYHLAGPSAWARDLTMRTAPPARLMQSYDWLYGFDIADSEPV